MWISNTSIRHPVFITMIFFALLVLGLISYTGLGVDLYPDVAFPVITVQTLYPGASPQEVETQVSKPLEDALGSLRNVKSVRSTSSEGLSQIIVEFNLEYSADKANTDVREKVALIRRQLPRDVEEPIIFSFDPSLLPILSIAVVDKTNALDEYRLRKLVEDDIRPRIERIEGSGAVNILGGLEREIQVELSLGRLQALRLSPQQVVRAISAENLTIPGGRITQGSQELSLRTPGTFQNIEQISQVVADNRGGTPIYIRDVANVKDGFKEKRSLSRLNGEESIVISIQKQSGTNTVKVSEQVLKEISRLRREYPGLDFEVVLDQSEFIKKAADSTQRDLIIGGLLASIVVLLFFRDMLNTLITVIGFPFIVISTFMIISFFGFTLNMVTLLALALCIGLLIDDAIVVRENIFRHMERGKAPEEAASEGTAEVALTVLAMTFTIVAVFLPVAFATGIIGRFLRQFGITVSAAVLISLFEAFTLAPMLSSRFFRRTRTGEEKALHRGRLSRGLEKVQEKINLKYRAFLGWSLSHKKLTLGLVAAIFFLSLGLLPLLGRSFTRSFERGQFETFVELPPGAALEITDERIQEIEKWLSEHPWVKYVFSTVGTASGPEKASLFIKLKDPKTEKPLKSQLRQNFSYIGNMRFSSESIGAGSSSRAETVFGLPFQLNLQTTGSLQELEATADQVIKALSEVPGLVDIDRSTKPGKPEVRVMIDRNKAADFGLSVAQIASTLRNLVEGEIASRYQEEGKETDIRVVLRKEDRQNYQDILSINLLNGQGIQVPLSSVASLSLSSGPTQVSRQDRQRQIIIGANYSGLSQSDIVDEVNKLLSRVNLPQGSSYKFGGETQMFMESFQVLTLSLLLSVLFIYMVLASQFGSFLQPFIIMVALPLAVIGAFLALLITGRDLDITAMIGIILLMGIAAKNSIMLVDFTNTLRRRGHDIREALLTAGPIRLRPVLMTSLSLIFGMLPVAMSLGEGAEFRSTMAIAVIGGLITSTFFTLIVVPAIYSIMEGLKARFSKEQGV